MSFTLIGTDEITSLSRRVILPFITDQVYASNALYFRLNAANRKRYEGGTHVEAPFMYRRLTNGGAFRGFDVVDVSPNETVKNGGWEMKEYEVPISIDRRTLIRMNSPLAVANELSVRAEQAKMHMADLLGTDLSQSEGSSGSTDAEDKQITGLAAVVDAGSATTAYAGLTRSTNPYLNAQINSTTATMTLTALRSAVSSCTFGAHSTTLIRSRSEQYDRFWSLCQVNQRFMAGQGQKDEALAQAGFTNLCFDNIPWIIDDKVADGPNTSNSRIEFLNETVFELAIFANTDFDLTDWRKPVDQPGVMTQFLLWNGEFMCTAPQLQGALTNISG
jgi:hypothetical protein